MPFGQGILLHLKNGRIETHLRGLLGRGPVTVLLASDGSLWVGTRREGALYHVVDGDPIRMTAAVGLADDEVNAIVESPDGDIWVGTEDGVFRWTGSEFTGIGRDRGLMNTDIHSLLIDRERQVWIGTFGSGVCQLRSPDIVNYGVDDGLRHAMVSALAHDGEDRILVGTIGGAYRLDPKTGSFSVVEPRAQLRAFHVDGEGTVWIGGEYHIWREGDAQRFPLLAKLNSLGEDASGRLYVATNSGLHTLEDGEFTPVALPRGVELPVYKILKTLDGSVLLGTAQGLVWGRNDQWTVALGDLSIRAIAEAPDGTLWLGTQDELLSLPAGVIGIDQGQLRTGVRETVGEVVDLVCDSDGTVWAATFEGVVRIRNGELERFTLADGLPSRNARCVLNASGGVLFVGTSGGLAQIDTTRLSPCLAPPRISIRDWSVGATFGQSKAGTLEIPYARQGLTIRVQCLGWRSAIGVRYQYKLAGRDEAWSDSTAHNIRQLAGLSPGRYTFMARAINARGLVSEDPAELTFTILPPFWQNPWYAGLAVTCLLGLGLLGVSARRRRGLLETERRCSEAALHQSKEYLRTVIDGIADFTVVIDRDFRIVLANQAACDLLGQDPVANRMTCYESSHHRDETCEGADFACPMKEVLARKAPVAVTHAHRDADGNEFVVDILASPIFDDRGEVVQIVESCRDVTEKMRVHAELKQAKEDAESASRSKSRFLANISHEVRTPIAALLGAAESLVKSDGRSEESAAYTDMILRNGSHLLSLVDDLLDLSRLDSGSLRIKRVACSLLEILDDARAVATPEQNGKPIDFEIVFETAIPTQIHTDPVRLRQVIINLINNALKFTEAGHIRVYVSVDPKAMEPRLRIAVEDTGVGLLPADQRRIFDPFAQVDPASGERPSGVGLGLPIAKRFAEQLGGTLTVFSAKGFGSTFTMRIATGPLDDVEWIAPDVASARPKRRGTHRKDEPRRSLRGSILLAEDAPDVRILMERALSDAGADVTVAADGLEAIQAASTRTFDLILMDIQMPKMDGISATAEIRRRKCLTPIVAMTASASQDDRRRILGSGLDDLWLKPISLDQLVEKAGAYLETGPDDQDRASENKLDLGSAVARPPAKRQPMEEAVAGFVDSIPARMDRLRAAFESPDFKAAGELLHQLVGTAGIHGAMSLSREAASLLERVRRGAVARGGHDLRAIEELADKIIDSFAKGRLTIKD
ncbi:MAG: response regulator [Planctomycetes bacterium]|nr:response regulator [Planctomycetota bacterium]